MSLHCLCSVGSFHDGHYVAYPKGYIYVHGCESKFGAGAAVSVLRLLPGRGNDYTGESGENPMESKQCPKNPRTKKMTLQSA